ncbi:hypothetical protein Mgra_00000873 [Meloidogyne graminicola]|uniref:Guanylate cyclase domain-containing protein n=1 Tax=Meloidogyne graminicola TaxID=189291 RepID=A0A8T0A0J8_9BILA|nr:hypothetical protein Mgra_00000873 [Meloidogyne graminicola]
MAIDAAIYLVNNNCSNNSILLSEDTWRYLEKDKFNAERISQGTWKLIIKKENISSNIQPLLFQYLQNVFLYLHYNKCSSPLYANILESFCHFVTRTSLGYCVTVLLVITALCTCGLANTYSCPIVDLPTKTDIISTTTTPCQPYQFSAISLALWMLLCSAFLRLSSTLLLFILLFSIVLFCPHLFITHSDLYPNLLARLDILTLLIGLSFLIFLLARRNELLLRMDFLALLKALPLHIALNFGSRNEPFSHLCPSVGILTAKIGKPGDWIGEFGFDRLNRLICEIDQRLGQLSECSRLEKVRTSHCFYTAACGILPELAKNVHDTPCTIGEQLASLAELAKFIQDLAESEGLDIAIGLDYGSALSMVVGGDRPRYELIGQPNTRAKKLSEAASALGSNCILLSEDVFLALRPRSQFYFDENNALSVAPGLIAYSLLRSLPNTIKQNNNNIKLINTSPIPPPLPPHRTNSQQQQQNNNTNNIIIKENKIINNSENNNNNIIIKQNIHSNPLLIKTNNNNNIIHSSAQSLCSSELFSIDLNLETDNSLEMEWVTPEMVANGQYRLYPESPQNNTTIYKSERADIYSEFSDAEDQINKNKLWRHPSSISTNGAYPSNNTSLNKKHSKIQRRYTCNNNGNNISTGGSDFSLSLLAGDNLRGNNNNNTISLQRLSKAANKMDKMLKEMAGIPLQNKNNSQQQNHPFPECFFPKEDWSTNNNDILIEGHYCHQHSMSEYENATNCSRRSLASCLSDFEEFNNNQRRKSISKLERLRQSLILNNNEHKRSWRSNSYNKNKLIIIGGDGNEADRSCSPSIGSMQQFSPNNNNKTTTSKLLKALKWRQSVSHSIGYDDEYELASIPLSSSYASSVSVTSWGDEKQQNVLPSVGENSHFIPIDAEDGEDKKDEKYSKYENKLIGDTNSLKKQMLELSREIRRDFGEFQLSRFSNDLEDCQQNNQNKPLEDEII